MSNRLTAAAPVTPRPAERTGGRAALPDSIRHLSRLLRQENEALADMDFERAGALLAPKHAAADALASAWRAASSLDSSSDELCRLGELADENRRLVNRAMRVQRRVLDLVSRAARDAKRGVS